MKTALFWVITQRLVVIPHDVSGQPVGHSFKGQESKSFFEFLTPEEVTDKLSRNVGKILQQIAA